MRAVSIRVSEDTIAFIKQEARRRGIKTESEMWRIIIERGVAATEGANGKLDALLKIGVQTLCLSQRVAGVHEESLIKEAREDSRVILKKMGVL